MTNYIDTDGEILYFHGFEAIKKNFTIFRSPDNGKILIIPGHICGAGNMYHYELKDRQLKDPALAQMFLEQGWGNIEFSFVAGNYFLMD